MARPAAAAAEGLLAGAAGLQAASLAAAVYHGAVDRPPALGWRLFQLGAGLGTTALGAGLLVEADAHGADRERGQHLGLGAAMVALGVAEAAYAIHHLARTHEPGTVEARPEIILGVYPGALALGGRF